MVRLEGRERGYEEAQAEYPGGPTNRAPAALQGLVERIPMPASRASRPFVGVDEVRREVDPDADREVGEHPRTERKRLT